MVRQSTFSALIFIFKGMKSPSDHNESKGLCMDTFPLGIVRMLVRGSPQGSWVDLLLIVFVVTIIGKRMCLPRGAATAGALLERPASPRAKGP